MKKILVRDDLNIGQAVTILHGPCETVMMPPMMLDGKEPPQIDTAVPGRVFIIEAVDLNTGLIMLKALDGVGAPTPKVQQSDPPMTFFPGESKPDTYMFELDKVQLAAVSPDWLTAYMRNFCAHKGGTVAVQRQRVRKARPAAGNEVAVQEGHEGERGPSE